MAQALVASEVGLLVAWVVVLGVAVWAQGLAANLAGAAEAVGVAEATVRACYNPSRRASRAPPWSLLVGWQCAPATCCRAPLQLHHSGGH
eukprot:7188262-Prymnesium_polylepis.1